MAQLPLGWKTTFILNGLEHKGEWLRDAVGGFFQHDVPYTIGSSRFPDVDFLEQFIYIQLVDPEPVEGISAKSASCVVPVVLKTLAKKLLNISAQSDTAALSLLYT